MKKLAPLCALLLAACSSSSKKAERPTMDESMTEPTSGGPSDMSTENASAEPSAEPSIPEAMPAPEPAPPVEPAEPPVPTAAANLVAIADGSAIGTITFEQRGSDINMVGTFSNLPPGPHAFYIHEVGDCTAKGKKVGKHLDPTKAKHGPPSSSVRHAGDLGDVIADANGNATFSMTTDSVVLEDEGRADNIIRKAVVIHAKKDDAKGKVNSPLACGVIEKVESGGDQQAATTAAP